MSENKNPLNDFLEMEENGTDAFADLPFTTPVPESFVQNASAQPPAPAVQPVAPAPAPQMQPQPQFAPPPIQPQPVYQAAPQQVQQPVQNSAPASVAPQGSLFEAAVAQTPLAQAPVMQPPVVQPPVVSTPVAQAPVAANPPAETPTQQTIADAADPFTAALATAKAQSDSRLVESCVAREAIFSYGKAKEPITDRDCTFEDLREKYESDFPELADSKKVEWNVTYGKESKTIKTPGSDKVYEIKAEIEKSKKFLDGMLQMQSQELAVRNVKGQTQLNLAA